MVTSRSEKSRTRLGMTIPITTIRLQLLNIQGNNFYTTKLCDYWTLRDILKPNAPVSTISLQLPNIETNLQPDTAIFKNQIIVGKHYENFISRNDGFHSIRLREIY